MRLILSLSLLCVACPAATLPLAFESRGAQYLARGAGYSVTIDAGGAQFAWGRQSFAMQVLGADSHAHLEGLGRMPGHVTYMLGTTRGATYSLYSQVLCRGIYPGVDVLYYGNEQRLEYDFHVAERASADSIALAFPGADRAEIDSAGDLVLHAGARVIRQPKPVAWQTVAGERRFIAVEYRKIDATRIGFKAGPHDPALPLVIDPAVVFDNLFGGTSGSAAAGLALDSQGNIYVAGATASANFATVNPVQGQLGTAPMLSSTDGGQTWTFETLGTAVSIDTVVAAPGSPSTLYANSEQGVFQSLDGGATWTKAANNGLVLPAVDITVDAGSPYTLYACNGNGIFVSTDAGNSWTLSNSGITALQDETAALCYAIRAHPAKPGAVFDMASDPPDLYRSTDSGATWTALTTGQVPGSVNTLAFNPTSPNNLIAGEISGGLLASTDGGNTWSPIGSQAVQNNHALVMDPTNPSTLYLANQTGVQKSSDGGNTWSVILPDPTLSVPYTAVLAIDTQRLYVFESRGLFISADGGQTWTMANLPYPVMPGSLYVAADGSRILLGTQSAGDAFVTKWDPTGKQVLYSTYLGGSGADSATGIAVDAAGSAYVLGTTSSANFPVTANAVQKTLVGGHNAFVAKLSPDGSHLVYSTYFGGGNEFTTALAIDSAGAAYFTGNVTTGFPVSANAFQKTPGDGPCFGTVSPYGNYQFIGDAFVAKISPDGSSLIYASYLGGICGERGNGIAANADGSAWVVGATFSPDFPVTSNAMQPQYGGGFGDGFVAKVSAAGALAYSTYLGGSDYDEIDALTLDASGNLYLTGSSHGFSQPASPGAFQPAVFGGCFALGIGPVVFNLDGNAFVMILNPTATAVTGLTYIGSPCDADGTAIALDPTGGIWIAGAPSTVFPTVDALAIQAPFGFVSKFSQDLTKLLFSTYFDRIGGLAVDSSGMAYVAGSTSNFTQAYVAKIDPSPSAIFIDNVLTASPFVPSPPQAEQITPGKVVRLEGQGIGPIPQTAGIVNGNSISTRVAGVQVTFDGTPAPLLYMSSTEIECIAPFEIAGQAMTTIQVTYNSAQSNPMAVPVYASSTEVLAVLNQDFTVNSPSNPGIAGSIMTLYLTGAGQTNPASLDGEVYTNPLPLPTGTVTVNDQGTSLPVTYAAAAYGLAAGILQVNFQAPAQAPAGALGVTANGSFAYFTVTVH